MALWQDTNGYVVVASAAAAAATTTTMCHSSMSKLSDEILIENEKFSFRLFE